ncbi:MAG: Glutamyl-tRNA(Gln) amidotransferase subunit A [Alphaproteobacteria bacterium MarineAlpha2_Bin1]|nr:MAG: Glutamyl-tRNA(Gln) amidotransferase subunit A [Alphaproteobacteria bacterium MarineAlpha2_Bin1]
MSQDVLNLSLVEVSKKLLDKEISSEELVKLSIESSKKWNTTINAFIKINEEDALIAARKADQALSKGKSLGALHGIPLAHKDLFYLKNQPITCGSKVLNGFTSNYDATIIDRLHNREGAINLGRLNMAEIAVGSTGRNEHYGHCRNPWDPKVMTGGSSSGSGAAVAARNVFGSLGTDTGGSIRIPSSACGLVGIKGTYGRVSRHGVMPLSYSLDNAGPMTRTVEDCARLFKVIAGYDRFDDLTSTESVPNYEELLNADEVKGKTIGIPKTYFFENVEEPINSVLQEALSIFKRIGVKIIEVDVSDQIVLRDMTNIILKSEVTNIHLEWLKNKPNDYQSEVRARLEAGLFVSAVDYLRSMRLRSVLTKNFVELSLSDCDLLFTPCIPIEPPTLEEIDIAVQQDALTINEKVPWCTRPLNYLGLPGISIPCGFSPNNIPIGFQLIGRPFTEDLLFNFGYAYQLETDWHTKYPTL